MESLTKNLPLFLPIIIVQIIFQITALIDLIKRNKEEIRWKNKIIWLIIIFVFGILGPILYFIFGRKS